MILYIENPKATMGKLLELINEYSKFAGYKINKKISTALICNNNQKKKKKKRHLEKSHSPLQREK